MPSNDLNAAQLGTVAGAIMPKPPTIASAAAVAPITFLTFISGTVAIATVTPPEDGAHLLCFIFTTTTPTAFTTTGGNIKAVATPTQNVPCFLVWSPADQKYFVKS